MDRVSTPDTSTISDAPSYPASRINRSGDAISACYLDRDEIYSGDNLYCSRSGTEQSDL